MIAATVRMVEAADHAAVRGVEIAAFGQTLEADLVEALREADDVVLELIAIADGEIAAHILFSRLWVEGRDGRFPAVALAPLAVAPAFQRRGIGGGLVLAGHERLGRMRETLSIVLGDPAYYGRFGYSHARAAAFAGEYQCEALQALSWGEAPTHGQLTYAPAFAAVS